MARIMAQMQIRIMDYVRRSLIVVCFVVAAGLAPLDTGGTSGRAYGYSEADLERVKNTNACPKCDLSGADLSGADLVVADLRSVNLSGASLKDAWMSNAWLTGANLRDADLSGANLEGADLGGADLRGANLTGTILTVVSVKGADFTGAKGLTAEQVSELKKAGAIVDVGGVGDTGGEDSSNISEAITTIRKRGGIEGLSITKGDRKSGEENKEQLLKTKECPGCDLHGVDLHGADLYGDNLFRADLHGANLEGAKLQNATL
ncbi:MAG: pentapeptide repeat-containing protein, partial [Candidatus Bathyanammoxibius sp.]